MGSVGMPELFVLLSILVLWSIPIIAAVWLLRTIAKIARVQAETLDCLKSIERKLDGKKIE
jgi:hypothetical protein